MCRGQAHRYLDITPIRYAQLCAEVGNCVANSRFVLQWMLHARLREARGDGNGGEEGDGDGDSAVAAPSTEEAGSDAAAARRRIHAALEALEATTTMSDVALAVGANVGAEVREPPPPPHARRYLGDYFSRLDEHGDWAGVPPREQYAAWHDADVQDAPGKDAARWPQRRPPARALPRAVPPAVPPLVPRTSKKRPRSRATVGGAVAAGGAAAVAVGGVEAAPSRPLVVPVPGAKRKKSRGVRLSKAQREARQEARCEARGAAEDGAEQGAPEEAEQD